VKFGNEGSGTGVLVQAGENKVRCEFGSRLWRPGGAVPASQIGARQPWPGPGRQRGAALSKLVHGVAFVDPAMQSLSVPNSEIPLLSVIIVAFQSSDEIVPCVESLPLRLNGRPVEVVVVNNSPLDDVATRLRPVPKLTYLAPATNLGFGRANNLGYAHSRGEYVLFLNPDTISNSLALSHCLQRLQRDSRIGLISPKLVQADGSMDLACRRSIPTLWDGFCRASGLATRFPQRATFAGYNLTHLPEEGTYDVGAINGAFMLSPRRVLETVAPDGKVFDEAFFMYGDDLDLCLRVTRAGWRIVYDGSVQITHLKGLSVAKNYEAMSRAIFDANRDVYLKHFNPRGSRFVQWKYRLAFGAWKQVALLRAWWRGHRQVRPV